MIQFIFLVLGAVNTVISDLLVLYSNNETHIRSIFTFSKTFLHSNTRKNTRQKKLFCTYHMPSFHTSNCQSIVINITLTTSLFIHLYTLFHSKTHTCTLKKLSYFHLSVKPKTQKIKNILEFIPALNKSRNTECPMKK